jgi:hypothetical protein
VVVEVLTMQQLVELVDLVVEVLNQILLVDHQINHHKTLVYQVFHNMVILVDKVEVTTVLMMDLVVEEVLAVLVTHDPLVEVVDLVDQIQLQDHP